MQTLVSIAQTPMPPLTDPSGTGGVEVLPGTEAFTLEPEQDMAAGHAKGGSAEETTGPLSDPDQQADGTGIPGFWVVMTAASGLKRADAGQAGAGLVDAGSEAVNPEALPPKLARLEHAKADDLPAHALQPAERGAPDQSADFAQWGEVSLGEVKVVDQRPRDVGAGPPSNSATAHSDRPDRSAPPPLLDIPATKASISASFSGDDSPPIAAASTDKPVAAPRFTDLPVATVGRPDVTSAGSRPTTDRVFPPTEAAPADADATPEDATSEDDTRQTLDAPASSATAGQDGGHSAPTHGAEARFAFAIGLNQSSKGAFAALVAATDSGDLLGVMSGDPLGHDGFASALGATPVLGFGTTHHQPTVVPSPGQVAHVVAAVVQALDANQTGTEFALSPEELGHVRVSIRPHDSDPNRVVVMMTFERPDAMDLFRRNADQLVADMRAAGFADADLSFSQSGSGGESANHSGADSGAGSFVETAGPNPVASSPPSSTSALDLRL